MPVSLDQNYLHLTFNHTYAVNPSKGQTAKYSFQCMLKYHWKRTLLKTCCLFAATITLKQLITWFQYGELSRWSTGIRERLRCKWSLVRLPARAKKFKFCLLLCCHLFVQNTHFAFFAIVIHFVYLTYFSTDYKSIKILA